jgi:uncharacterized membrane protein
MFGPNVWTFAALGTLALLYGFAPTMEVRMRGGGLLGAIVVVWLVIGVIAAFQRDYLKNTDQNCASLGTIAVGLGIILLILGYVLKVAVLQTIGVVLLVIGAVLWVLGSVGRPVGGRRYWY